MHMYTGTSIPRTGCTHIQNRVWHILCSGSEAAINCRCVLESLPAGRAHYTACKVC